jgi:hypothetical protein
MQMPGDVEMGTEVETFAILAETAQFSGEYLYLISLIIIIFYSTKGTLLCGSFSNFSDALVQLESVTDLNWREEVKSTTKLCQTEINALADIDT